MPTPHGSGKGLGTELPFVYRIGVSVGTVGLAKEAPRAKKALEMFIHKVKAMLKKNSCMTAMWTKTLKEKDIAGTTLKDEGGSKEQDESEEDEGESSEDEEEEESDGSKSAESENSEDEYDTDDD